MRELICKNNAAVVQLVREWHEAGRADFARRSPGLDYDGPSYVKKVVQRRKYLLLDEGYSGAYVMDRDTGEIWRLKSAYGRPDKRKLLGFLGSLTGAHLHKSRWW